MLKVRGTGQLGNLGSKVHATCEVMKLMDRKLNLCQHYLDNIYNSYDLTLQLLHSNTCCTTTLHVDCKSRPTQVAKSELKE
jgi:hypothetical protein